MTRSERTSPSFLSRFVDSANAPVDAAPVVWFRFAFGIILLVEVLRFFSHGWIVRYYVQPNFHFSYFGFSWVTPWSAHGMNLHFAVLAALAVCIALGFFYRVTAALFFLGFTYVFLLDQARYLNHFYLVCLYAFLIAIVPAHRALSFDAWRKPALRSEWVPVWTVWVLRAQICVVYFFGGIAKLNGDWLHGEPMRMWLARRTDFPVVGPWLTHEWVVNFFTFGGLLFDLGIVPLLLWRRTRWIGFVFAAIFNATNAWLFDIGIFPWLAFGATVILFAPRLPLPGRDFWRSEGPPAPLARRGRILGATFLATYLAIQFLVPLRHWIYPGDVQWTEEGHRFSWRMKLRSKSASMVLYAHDPDSNQTWRVADPIYINSLQRGEAAGRPDMILQLCHCVADDFRQQGFAHVQVRAHVSASLNGRAEQPLIDPEVDLAAQPRTLRHVSWIVPLTTPLSERLKAADAQADDVSTQADPE